jgi:hypothetical protein
MTRGELRQRAQQRFAAAAAGFSPYTDAQVNAALNEGQALFGLLTLCVERTAQIPIQPGVTFRYLLQDVPDFFAPLRMRCRRVSSGTSAEWDEPKFDERPFDDPPTSSEAITPVRPATLAQLDAIDPNWRAAQGETVLYYGCQGLDLAWIYPTPTTSATALLMTYAAEPGAMAGDDSVPEIPEEFHPALVSYALCTLPLMLGGSELARTAPQWDMFMQSVQQCASYIRNRNRGHRYDTAPPELVLAAAKPPAGRKPGGSN